MVTHSSNPRIWDTKAEVYVTSVPALATENLTDNQNKEKEFLRGVYEIKAKPLKLKQHYGEKHIGYSLCLTKSLMDYLWLHPLKAGQ